jgi:hypothetical protein
MSMQDRLNDVLQPRVAARSGCGASPGGAAPVSLVGDPDLRQKAAGVELRQHPGIELVGFDLVMGNQPDLLWIGDNNPADARSDRGGNRSRIAGGFDDDNVAVA